MTEEANVNASGALEAGIRDCPACAIGSEKEVERSQEILVVQTDACPASSRCLLGKSCAARVYLPKDVDQATQRGVDAAVIFMSSLQWGQIIDNFREPQNMEGLAWSFYGTGAIGYLIMASYFCSIGETSGSRMCLFSACITVTPLIQMFALTDKSLVPILPFWLILVTFSVGFITIVVRLCGWAEKVFAWWMHIATTAAGALVGFTVDNMILQGSGLAARLPSIKSPCNGAGAAIGFAVLLCMVLCKKTTNRTGALLATALFLYQPWPEVVKIFSYPASGADFDLSYIYFNMLGSALELSRCIYIQDWIWIICEISATFIKGVLLSVSIFVANERLPVPFLNPFSLHVLVGFNIAISIYAFVLFAYLPRKPISETHDQEPTREEDPESSV
jgi:lipid-A-disaccharide synthase-like uncharacterized protein